MKLESFHEARFNFFLSSVEADPADFEVVPGFGGLVFEQRGVVNDAAGVLP